MPHDDNDLIPRIAAGDLDAFAGLMEQHGGALYRYLLRMVGSAAAAEDLLQETFVAAFEARERYRAQGSPRAWLLTIARNRARNALRASDLHLMVGYPPSFRVHGELVPEEGPALEESDVRGFIAELMPAAEAAHWAEDPMASAHFGYDGPGGTRFRTFIHKHVGGSAISMRALPSSVPAPDAIGLPASLVDRVCSAGRGLVIVTGEAGSGKSTTLYSLVEQINATRGAHIVFICDFADYVMHPKKSLIRTIEVGAHLPSFAEAARACTRIDPDVIVFGEWRDLETISSALALAEMGHLVFALLHCDSAAETIARIVDVYPVAQQGTVARRLARTIQCVIAQRLLPKADGKGRVAAHEVLLGTPCVRELIADQRFRELPGALAEGESEGMWTMGQCVRRLAEAGTIRG